MGSTFTPTVKPAVASATESDIRGEETRTGTAGVMTGSLGGNAGFRVYLRDAFENYLQVVGNNKIKCIAALDATHQSAWQRTTDGGGDDVNGVSVFEGEVEGVYEEKFTGVPCTGGHASCYSCDFVPA